LKKTLIVLTIVLVVIGAIWWRQQEKVKTKQLELDVIQNELAILKEAASFRVNTAISQPAVVIIGGNLHWHKKILEDTFCLEEVVLEVRNFEDTDFYFSELRIRVDGCKAEIFPVDFLVPAQSSKEISVLSSLGGFDGEIHQIYFTLLTPGEEFRCFRGEEVGPIAFPK